MVSIYVGFLVALVLWISFLIGKITGEFTNCYMKSIVKNVVLPLVGAVYVHEVLQYLPLMTPVKVTIDFKKLMFVWEPTVEVSSIRKLCGWILGFIAPFIIGIILVSKGNGIAAIPLLLVSISGIIGIWEGWE